MITFRASNNYKAKTNTIAGSINLTKYIPDGLQIQDAWINVGGWQSWNPAYEIEPGTKQSALKCHLIHQWNKYLVFPGTKYNPSKNIVLSQFITYLRWETQKGDFYLVLASTGNINKILPPVQFIIERNTNTVKIELCDKNKSYIKDELQAEIEIFTSDSYFDCRNKLEKIFGSSDSSSSDYSHRFDQLQHFGKTIYGWESWYNHYSNINEQLIREDLESLKTTKNLITLSNAENVVFQIDDGWEKALGDWEVRKDRFSEGLKPLTESIENRNYIPGLWIAPFIIDLRSDTAKQHPEWLLRDNKGNLVSAGFNPLWGSYGTFYALDLSNYEVQHYLQLLAEKIINQWGFRYIKYDFLYAGMIDGLRQDGNSAYESYSKALQILTSIKTDKNGKKIAYLGCGVPFEQSFNYLPLSRIGCDTFEHWENKLPKRLNWNGRNSAYLNIKDTLGHAMWDKIVFSNDPDVIFIRNENCSLTKNEKLLIAAVNSIFGSQIMYSDDPAKSTSQEELELTEEIIHLQQKLTSHEYSIKNTKFDEYEITSKDNSIHLKINLNKAEKFTLETN